MKTKLSILFLGLTIFLLVFASAVKDNETGREKTENQTQDNEGNESQILIAPSPTSNMTEQTKNLTYGRCVSEFAKAEKTCYKSTKDKSSNCKSSAENKTKTKDETQEVSNLKCDG